MAKPMKTLELHYPMIQFLIISGICLRTISAPRSEQLISFEEQTMSKDNHDGKGNENATKQKVQ